MTPVPKKSGRLNSKTKYLEFIVIFFSFFPWISFGLNNLDSQPWLLMSSIAYLIFRRRLYIPKLGLLFVVLMVLPLPLLILLSGADYFYLARGLAGYATISAGFIAWLNIIRDNQSLIKCFISFNLVWLIGGVVQLVFGADIFGGITQVRTTESRGVPSFGVEPTYFGLVLVFFSWIILISERGGISNQKIYTLITLNIFGILFLAKSAMAVMIVLFILLALSIFHAAQLLKRPFLIIIFTSLFVGIVPMLAGLFLADSRVVQLFSLLADQPAEVLALDQSVNERVSAIYYSFHGFFTRAGIPGGFVSMQDTASDIYASAPNVFSGLPSNKIMSWSGAMVYELGVFGILSWGAACLFFWRFHTPRVAFLSAVIFGGISLVSMPHGFGLIPVLLATVCGGPRTGRAFRGARLRQDTPARTALRSLPPAQLDLARADPDRVSAKVRRILRAYRALE